MHLQAFPQLLTWNYTLKADDGRSIRLATAYLRERGWFTLDGTAYTIGRDGFIAAPFVLRDKKAVVAAARKTPFVRSFDLTTSVGSIVLAAQSVFMRRFLIQHGNRTIGTITPAHAFTRRAHMHIEGGPSLPECVFLFWLAMLTWRRASRNASS